MPLLVTCVDASSEARARDLAERLSLPFSAGHSANSVGQASFLLIVDAEGLGLQQTGAKAPGIIRADFVSGAVNHRRQFGGGKGQLIAKALGLKSAFRPFVLDATAGLGKDAFVLATLGCRVQMHERNPVVYALLESGLAKAREVAGSGDFELDAIMSRLELVETDSLSFLREGAELNPDVIYLDPMFPDRQKSASVKKEMKAFHQIVGSDEDASELLGLALSRVNYRVVVKRPRKAPCIDERKPSIQLEGKAGRYDVYTVKKMP